jgi:hypothetical protein
MTAQGVSGSPGRDAPMPPGLEERAPEWRVAGDCGRSRAGGRMPARDHPAGLDAGRRPGPRNVVAGPAGAVQAAGVQAGAAARDVSALPDVTLSDMEGRENAHTPAGRQRLHDRSVRGPRQSWAVCAPDAGCQHPVMPMKGRRDMRILRGPAGCTCWAGRTGGRLSGNRAPQPEGPLKRFPDSNDEFQHSSGSSVTSTFRADLEAP